MSVSVGERLSQFSFEVLSGFLQGSPKRNICSTCISTAFLIGKERDTRNFLLQMQNMLMSRRKYCVYNVNVVLCQNSLPLQDHMETWTSSQK